MRVLTVAIVIMIISSLTLLSMVVGLQNYASFSRTERLQFQLEETARQCTTLRVQGVGPSRLRSLGC